MKIIRTQSEINSLKPSKEPTYYKVANTKGLYLYSGKNRISFSYRYTYQDKLHSINIKTNQLSVAIDKYLELRNILLSGINPKGNAITFGELYKQYINRNPLSNKTQISVDKRLLNQFGEVDISNLNKKNIIAFLENHSYSVANQFKVRLSSLFSYAVNKGIIETNPLKEFKLENAINKPKIQSYQAIEIESFKGFVDTIAKDNSLKEPIRNALLFALCVPLRMNEIRTIERSFFNDETNTLLIPSHCLKGTNPKPFEVELKGKALEYFLNAFKNGNRFVFSLDKRKPLNQNTITQNFKKVCNITTHQTRSTFSTHCYSKLLELREKGISDKDIELALNHSIGSKIQSLYNQSTMKALITNILEWWQEEVHKVA